MLGAFSFHCSGEKRTNFASFSNAPVILISIDTLRSDRLPAYGYSKVKTPHLDALARESVLFERAFSPCPMTLPAHASMMSGLLPIDHAVRNNVGYTFDGNQHLTLAAFLGKNGYATGAAVSSYVLRSETGIDSGFEFYADSIPMTAGDALGAHQRSGRLALADALPWIGSHKTQPFFFFLHLYEPHAPYQPAESFRHYPDKYDGEVATVDAIVGDFISELKKLGTFDKAIIIITSDHGEGLYDHGEDQHGVLLYRESIQVPLLIKLPKGAQGGRRVSEPAQLTDLFPTVAALLGLEGAPRKSGIPLLTESPGPKPGPRLIYSETFYPRIHLGWSELRSVFDGQHHFIESPRPELYDMKADPGERKDLIDSSRRQAVQLRKALAAFEVKLQPLGQIDPETAAKLSALGYIGSARTASDDGPLPNPVDHLKTLDEIKRGFKLADERKYDQSAQVLRALIRDNQASLDVWDKLGEVLSDAGRFGEAESVYKDAIKRFPNFSGNLILSLASVYMRWEKFGQARQYAELGVPMNPPKAHELLARIALARGDLATAGKEIEAAMGGDAAQPALMLVKAEIAARRGSIAAAVQIIDEAERIAASTGVGPIHRLSFLRGDLLARTDRPAEAEAAFKKEIQFFPNHLQAYTSLAVVYFAQGKQNDMRAILRRMTESNPGPRSFEIAAETFAALDQPMLAAEYRGRARRAR